jgi:uncharacterized circularly permuted ATP-grasp superfamily protein
MGTPSYSKLTKGNVALVNTRNWVVDDKVVYTYVPRIIKYYLGRRYDFAKCKTYICDEEEP